MRMPKIPTAMNLGLALYEQGALKRKPTVKVGDMFALGGGLNVMDPPLVVAPGELLGCLNFEPGIIGGYRRCDGYERFDGHPSPSNTPWVALQVTSLSAFTPSPGATLTESGSGVTATVAWIDTTNLVVVVVFASGSFVGNGSTLTSGSQTTTTVGAPYLNGGPTNALSNTYFLQKWLYLQTPIGAVGGSLCSGPVLGVAIYGNGIYAIRNNSAGTAALMFVATPTGWSQINLCVKIRYNAGVYANAMQVPADGTVLTGATSGATFTLLRTATLTGTWGTDAAGYFIAASITGTPVANELLKSGTTTVATYLSSAAQTLPPNGLYQFRTHNFDDAQVITTGFRLYGVNGVGNGFEYDSSAGAFTLIETGMSPDTPTHLEVHANYLFYAFPDGSLQNSGYQMPLNWNVVFGADSRSVGEPVTFLREDVSQTLVIGTRRRIWTITGLTVEQFQIQVYSANTGAYPQTDEAPGSMVFAEDRGITAISAAQQYGDFEATTLSNKILKLMVTQLQNDTPVGAFVTRKKNLYRLVFASGTIFSLAINASGQFAGWCSSYWVHPPTCVFGGFWENSSGYQQERAFFGGTDGYVREVDQGRSYDGQNVQFFMRTVYWHSKTPDVFKRYRRAQIDIAPEGQASVNIVFDCDFGKRGSQGQYPVSFNGNGAYWDVGDWDTFNWDGGVYTEIAASLDAEGYNISLLIGGNAQNDCPFTASGVSYQESYRIINRNTQAVTNG